MQNIAHDLVRAIRAIQSLAHEVPVLALNRNQSIDLHCKSVTGFYMRATLALNGLNRSLDFKLLQSNIGPE